jgi:hypothetical protein
MLKPVEIIGDRVGNQRSVIHARGRNALVFRASSGVVRNLELRQIGAGNVCCFDPTCISGVMHTTLTHPRV